MKAFFAISAISSLTLADNCKGQPSWIPKAYTGGQTVEYQGDLYKANWSAGPANKPIPQAGSGSPWSRIASCKGGAAASGLSPAAGNLRSVVDCGDAAGWVAKDYDSNTLHLVHHNNIKYKQNYRAAAGNVPGDDAAWTDLGECAEGSAASGESRVQVDCSDAVKWVAKNWDADTLHTVHYNNIKYKQNYWAAAEELPGSDAAWSDLGECIKGTAGTGPIGPTIDCSDISAWSGKETYAAERAHHVHFEGNAYVNKYWTSGDKPGVSEVWELVGVCEDGTAPEGPAEGSGLSPALEADLCSCCQGCAKVEVTGPMCIDKGEEDCYYTWCPKYNTFDPARCEEVKSSQVLHYYEGEITEGKKVWPKRVYAPYFDSGLAQFPKLTHVAQDLGIQHFIAAFIVSSNVPGIKGCHGAWAGAYPVKMGPTSWNQTKQNNDYLFEEISKLRDLGGDIVVSFGGAMNVELADAKVCQEGDAVANLVKAYSEVIDFAKLTHIDFDIEGAAYAAINRETGWKYRFAAVKELEIKYPDLKVWWTLPILPSGLTLDGMLFMHDLMASGVRIDSFNVMNMDYGDDTICPGDQMGPCEISAMENLASQMFSTAQELNQLSKYGWTSPQDVYPLTGTIPMLGKNDIVTETYTLDDARKSLNEWMTKKPIGVLSNWSLARDSTCPDLTYVDVSCSSYHGQTEQYEYAKIFAPYTSE